MHRRLRKYGAIFVVLAFMAPAGMVVAQSDALLAAALLDGNVNVRTSRVLLGGIGSLDDVASALDDIETRRSDAIQDLRDLERECSESRDDLRDDQRNADTSFERSLARDQLRDLQRECNRDERELRDLVRDLDRDERSLERAFGDSLALRRLGGTSISGLSSLDEVRDAFETLSDREREVRDELRALESDCDERERSLRDDIRDASGDARDRLRNELAATRVECREEIKDLRDDVRSLDQQERRLRSAFGNLGAFRSISVDTDRLNSLNRERIDAQRELVELTADCRREEAELRADARASDDRDERRDISDRLSELRRECRDDERELRNDIRALDRERNSLGRDFGRGSSLFGSSRIGGLGTLGLLGSFGSSGFGFTRSSSGLDLDRDDVLLALALR